MGGGFMADNKDMTMQQQTINNKQQQTKKPLQQHTQQQDLPRHSHQALSSPYPNPKLPLSSVTPAASPVPLKRKTPDPPSTSSPPPTTSPSLPSKPLKKKLLKVILKVPHSSPSSSSPSSSPPPLSRPSPRSPPPLSHHPHHHPLSPPSARSSAPLSPPPYPSPSSQHPPKPTSEIQKFHHHHHPRPSKPPLQPPLQQIKHPPLDPKQPRQHLHKKSPHPSQIWQKGDRPSPISLSAQQEISTRQQNHVQISPSSSQPRPQQEDVLSKPRHRENQANPACSKHSEDENRRGQANSSSAKWPDQANLARIKRAEQHDDTYSSRLNRTEQEDGANFRRIKGTEEVEEANRCRFKRIEQIDQADSSNRKLTESLDQTNPRLRKQTEQVGEFDQAHLSCSNWTEQVDPSPSRAKRLETWQLDEEAIPKRPQRHQEPKEVQYLGSHPKRLRTLQQSQQEQTNGGLGSPNFPQQRLPQISPQQQTAKKLTQIPVQGAHGLHQSPKLPSVPIHASSPHPLLPSTSASLQSSAPSLSTSALSDEAQKPTKKRKLRSLLEPVVKHGLSVADQGGEGHLHYTSLTPTVTLSDNSPSVKLHDENQDFQERAAASSSPKTILNGPLLVPAKKLLKGILDRLQKKDKFGVFAEPVDKNEVPNYYDIIKDPMDFGTMRNRISLGHYISLDLFQKDIFLICDNAMNYNGKGTVYFRHARSIKDIAERILEDLKVSGLSMEMDEPMAKQKSVVSGRSIEKHDSYINMGSPSEIRADNGDDFPGYVLRSGGLIDGRRYSCMDENRRSTYMPASAPFQGNDPLLTTISGESPQFVPTGYQMDFPYAKSLARFAADLGPAVWKVAEEKIRRALPPGFAFGPGWVGEREASSGIVIAPPSKQQSQGQPSTQPAPNSHNDSGAITTGNSSGVRPKPDNQSHAQPGHSHDGMVSKLDHHPGTQVRMQVAGKAPSAMVFGNALVHNERPNRLEQQALAQPAVDRLHTSDNTMIPMEVSPTTVQASMVKPDQPNGGVGNRAVTNRSKFSSQVNLNHPISFQADEGDTNEDPALHTNNVMKSKDDREGKVNARLLGPSNPVIPVSNAGSLPCEGNGNKGSANTSRVAPLLDMANSIKGTNGGEPTLAGMSISGRSQFDSRPSLHLSRLNSLNESPSEGASPANSGKSNAFHQYDSSRGSLMPHNLNLPLQQPSSTSRVHSQDANLGDLTRPNSSQSHSSQGLPLSRNLNLPAQQALSQQSPSSSQQFIPNNHGRPRDTSPLEPGLPKQAPPCPEQAVGERFREAGRDGELSSSVCSTPTGMMMPRKGFVPERAFILQQLESTRNGQVSNHDLVHPISQSLDQLNRRQNPSAGLSASGFPTGLPTSNGGFKIREESRPSSAPWVPAQQPDSMLLSGKGGMMHSQAMRSPADQQEGTPGSVGKPQNMRLASMQQLQGAQNAPVFGYGNQKQVSSMPHFLQQRLGHDAHVPIQHQQMQLHLQGSSMKPGAQNSVASESRDPLVARQFQIASHRGPGFAQAGNSGWQSVHPQMGSQGLHQPYAAAPDLNVSLPLTKSPFDQPNGNDIQQPDLALQL